MVIALLGGAAAAQQAPPAGSQAAGQPVTVDNFRRAETDTYFGKNIVGDRFGKIGHERELIRIDAQTVVRSNRDTLYSMGIFDLDAGPVTVTLPDSGDRFMSLMTIDEDQYNPVATLYAPGSHTWTREEVGTRYVMFVVRTFVDPNDPADMNAVHALQDRITSRQAAPGTFDVPGWDQTSLKRVRDALAVLNNGLSLDRMFGARDAVDPVHHLIGTATGWGGNPSVDAMYAMGSPARNDGTVIHRMTVKDVPVDGFWSVSVYNADGFFEANPQNAYSLNNVTAEAESDGSYNIQFGGCDGAVTNCLPTPAGWNYAVRMYRPRAEVLDGRWKFPEAVAAE